MSCVSNYSSDDRLAGKRLREACTFGPVLVSRVGDASYTATIGEFTSPPADMVSKALSMTMVLATDGGLAPNVPLLS